MFKHKIDTKIIVVDLLIALFAFWAVRYFGTLPKWYWLVLSSIIWVVLSCFSGKLKFGQYKRIRYTLIGILTINFFTGVFIFFLYRHFIPGYKYDYSILIAVGIISLLECFLYFAIRKFVYKKIPFFYEDPSFENITKYGVDGGATISTKIENDDVDFLLENARKQKDFTSGIKENKGLFSNKAIIVETANPEDILSYKTSDLELVINILPLNKIRHINTGLAYTNYCLRDGGYVACNCITSDIRKEKILKQSPIGINRIILFFDYIWHRMMPKISPFNKLYYLITKGERRSLTRVEVLGRFYRAGFEVVEEDIINGRFHIIAVKVKPPIRHDKPSNGILIRLQRVGKNGKIIGVYKLRTMHAYSEYLQPYIYKISGLAEGGKFADDYRITPMGKFLRKTWLDELPMLINWVKGDMKIVGVRPLSLHYFNLYSKELQELRIKVKPGLFPAGYAENMPLTIADIEACEKRYLNAYLQHPFRTDFIYLWRGIVNIISKRRKNNEI